MSFGVQRFNSRKCGLYEATDLLLGDHLCEESVCIYGLMLLRPTRGSAG